MIAACAAATVCITVSFIPSLTSGQVVELPNTFTALPTYRAVPLPILPTPDLPEVSPGPEKDGQSLPTASVTRSTTRATQSPRPSKTIRPQAKPAPSPTARRPTTQTTTKPKPSIPLSRQTTKTIPKTTIPPRPPVPKVTPAPKPIPKPIPPVTNNTKCGTIGLAAEALRGCNQILAAFPEITTVLGRASRAGNPTSCHPRGLAIDLLVYTNRTLGDRVYAYVKAHQQDLGAYPYAILWQVADHFDHVHVSFLPCEG